VSDWLLTSLDGVFVVGRTSLGSTAFGIDRFVALSREGAGE
jgi:hypothetical protein